jgi:hypothetical protein
VPRFRRLAAVGHGGMADLTVAARDVGGSVKILVLKELRPALTRDPEYLLMFQREARARRHRIGVLRGERRGRSGDLYSWPRGQVNGTGVSRR